MLCSNSPLILSCLSSLLDVLERVTCIIYCPNWETFESERGEINSYVRTIVNNINQNCSGQTRIQRRSGACPSRPSGGHSDEGTMGGSGFNEEEMGVVLNDEGKVEVAYF